MTNENKEKYSDTLPKKYMAAGALFFNENGDLLILHPSYKDRWEIAGGIVEANESPRAACEREIKEELGLDVNVSRLLCVDYSINVEGVENLQFVFDGGVLTKAQIDAIHFPDDEIRNIEFIATKSDEHRKWILQRKRLGARVLKAIEARNTGTAYYLEMGE